MLVTHAGLENLIRWHHSAFNVDHTAHATLMASPAFDASIWELWPYLTAGATVYIASDETRLDPRALYTWLLLNQITITFQPPAITDRLLEFNWPAQAH